MFKHNKAMFPNLFNDVFELSPMTHKYSTRQNSAYKMPFCRTKCRQLSLADVRPKHMEHSYIRQLCTIFCHFAHLKKSQISASVKPVIICYVCIEFIVMICILCYMILYYSFIYSQLIVIVTHMHQCI